MVSTAANAAAGEQSYSDPHQLVQEQSLVLHEGASHLQLKEKQRQKELRTIEDAESFDGYLFRWGILLEAQGARPSRLK